jgi:hypothetical protein
VFNDAVTFLLNGGEFAGMGLCYRPPRAHVPVVRAGGGVVQPRQGGFVLK